MKTIRAAMVLLVMWGPSTRTGFWKTNGGERQYMVTSTFRDRPDRVCGMATQQADGSWIFDTSKALGARHGVTGHVLTFDEARAAIEQDCK